MTVDVAPGAMICEESIAFADRGARVAIYDVSESAVQTVNTGRMPFAEPGAEEVLGQALGAGRLVASADPAIVGTAEHVVVVIGTPVDEHLNPDQTAIPKALGGCVGYLHDGQLLGLRSTVFPGVTALVEKMVAGLGVQIRASPPRRAGRQSRPAGPAGVPPRPHAGRGRAVGEHRAGAADAVLAAQMRAGEAEFVAQEIGQR